MKDIRRQIERQVGQTGQRAAPVPEHAARA
jgi:hypothetical protein